MLFSKNRFYRQAEQSDKHLLVNGPVNLMVDSRGVTRPFGICSPLASPSAKPLDKSGSLRRDTHYSYLYTYFDSYNDAESEPSPATDYVGLSSIGTFSSIGFLEASGGEGADFSKLLVSGELEKEPGYYNGQSLAVEVINNDRKTEYSQWQYRKIVDYYWDAELRAGVFTLSRPLLNVDSDPEERHYKVKISDVECEEGVVGGKSSGKQKLILDPSASTDIGSYRLKVIRITAGKGKGQSRLIVDASINPDGLVEITLAKPWKTKPRFSDPNDPNIQAKQLEWKNKTNVKVQYFNKWFSSEYMIYDPMRHSGLCIDGEVSSYDKKTGLYVIDGLGNGSAILSGQVVRFVQGDTDENGNSLKPSRLVISLSNANTAEDWIESKGLIDKTLRITSGPGSGSTFVIVDCEKSGENSISLSLSATAKGATSSVSLNGTPNASSTYVIFSADPVSSPDLSIVGYPSSAPPSLSNSDDPDDDKYYPQGGDGLKYQYCNNLSTVSDTCFLTFWRDNPIYDQLSALADKDPSTGDPDFSSLVGHYVTFYGIRRFTLNDRKEIKEQKPDKFRAYTGVITSVSLSPFGQYVSFGFDAKNNLFPNQSKKFVSVVTDGGGNATPQWNNTKTKGKGSSSVTICTWAADFLYLTEISSAIGHPDDPSFEVYVSDFDSLGLDPYSYIPCSYSLTFSVWPDSSYKDTNREKHVYRITRPIIGLSSKVIPSASEDEDPVFQYSVLLSGNLPVLHTKESFIYSLVPQEGCDASVIGNSLMEGYYTGWIALLYNPDNNAKPKMRYRTARVAGYFDATGSILLDTKLSGVTEGWQVVLYSEYSRCLGSAIAPYDSDEFYEKKPKAVKYYQEYVPLEVFASSEETDPETDTTPYEGWTLKALSSSKTKKNGTIKYKTFSDKKTNKSKRTIVKYFPKSRRAYVFYKENSDFPSDESQYFNPGLDGSEHLWLYDESSAVDVLFNEDSDSSLDKDKDSEYGCCILVSDIRPCAYAGVDKIRLYRASEETAAYHLVTTLDNKVQEYEDNIPDEELSREIDMGHTVLPPCGVCSFYKGRFVAGGIPDYLNLSEFESNNPVVSPIPGSYYALFPFDPEKPIFDGYTYTDGKNFNSTILKSVPVLSTPFSRDIKYTFPVTDKLKSEKVKVSLLISEPEPPADPSKPGDYSLLAYAFQTVVSGRTQTTPVQLSQGLPISDDDNDFVYLPRSASSSNDFYNGCRFTVSSPYNTDPDYPKSFTCILSTGDYHGASRCLRNVRIRDFYNFPSRVPLRYPAFPFSIDRIMWSLKCEPTGNGYKYLYSDVFGNSSEVSPVLVDGPDGKKLLSLSFTAYQGSDYSSLEYHLGGDLTSLGGSASADLFAFSYSDSSDNLIESYLPSLGKLVDPRSDSGLVFTIPGSINNQLSASAFTSSSSVPFSRSMPLSDSLWYIALFDKYNSLDSTPGTAFLFTKGNGYTVYVCSPESSNTEKTRLADTYTFADDFGDRITGLVGYTKFIIVFKERGIYALDPDEPLVKLITHDVGCIATDSIACGRSGVYWLSSDRRVLRSSFSGEAIYYASKELQPWLDGEIDVDGESFDASRIREVKATYDADSDEYMIAFPTKTGKWFLFAFCDDSQHWFRIDDHSGTDELCSENAFNCLFKHHGRASFCSDFGLYSYSEGERPSFYPWKFASVYLTQSNSGMRKLVKRIQIINQIDKNLPAEPVPCAYFEFYRDMTDEPEESYQQEGRYTRRFFDTNKFVQYVHVGVRSLMWNFIMFSSDQDKVSPTNFVRIHDFALHYRNKHEDEPRWNATPYSDPPIH